MLNVDFSQLRFLIVDDNAHMRRVVRTLIHGFGAREVTEAEDGATGLEIFQSTLPDVVVTDWVMPIFSGIELTRMMRSETSSANPTVPIIMLTGHSEKKCVTEARDAGVTEFLCKPISAKALYARVANCLVNPRPFIKAAAFYGPDRRRFSNPLYKGAERRANAPAQTDDAEANVS
ncbi:response regulator [Cohaesibacter gelatinilyticus]|uniref:Response regulator receiver domain-containing protein n=1 Tax=Cohaesibacter gelatinilyticus TaxID=372072 RepID=A0A285NKP1_9HYPH|nr:response regulator [Cohaesibacter gelatinilyticus]SNZ08446.1 Response regulator receiver domain-containing protein [Cohaesibacter gelatinilyticus]